MASPTIQFKRGQAANVGLASFKSGEPGFTTDKYDFYIGLDGTHTNQKFFGSSRYWEREDGTNAAQLKFVDKAGSNSINFQAPDTLSGIGTWILPAYDAGASGEFLKIASVSGNEITLDWTTTPAADLVTLSGVAAGETDLGSFTGSTIADDKTVKEALQQLETSLETVSGGGSASATVAVAATDTNAAHYITFVDANNASKNQEEIETDAGLSYNPSTNLLSLSNLSISGVAVTAILDEDNLASNRVDALATQQSIKAYVDNNSPETTVDISGDTGTASVSTGATFAFTGTAPVNIAASGAGVTFSLADKVTAERFAEYDLLEAPHSATTKTITVTVATKTTAHRYNGSGSSSGYVLDGVQSPFLTLTPGRTYKFDQADSSNSGHPLLFYLESDKTTQYTTNVTTSGTPGSSGAYTQIVVGDETPPVLHYQCSAHGLMGNAVATLSNVVNSNYNATLRGTLTLGTSTAVNAILDQDNMSSDSATSLATQQSIKAYVDTTVGAVDVTTSLAGDSGTGSVSTSQTLTIAGTSNEVETSASGQTVTIGLPNDVTIGQDLTVTRNLYVNGSTTQVNVSALTVDDPLVATGTVNGSAPSSDLTKDLGILMHYYTGGAAKLASVYWDNSEARMVMASVVTESSNVLTATTRATVEIGSLMLSDGAGTGESVITVSGSDRVLQNILVDGGSF